MSEPIFKPSGAGCVGIDLPAGLWWSDADLEHMPDLRRIEALAAMRADALALWHGSHRRLRPGWVRVEAQPVTRDPIPMGCVSMAVKAVISAAHESDAVSPPMGLSAQIPADEDECELECEMPPYVASVSYLAAAEPDLPSLLPCLRVIISSQDAPLLLASPSHMAQGSAHREPDDIDRWGDLLRVMHELHGEAHWTAGQAVAVSDEAGLTPPWSSDASTEVGLKRTVSRSLKKLSGEVLESSGDVFLRLEAIPNRRTGMRYRLVPETEEPAGTALADERSTVVVEHDDMWSSEA